MVLYADKHFITNSEHPNDDWIGNADWVIPDGSELAEKIIRLYPNFEFVFAHDTNDVADVIETPHESLPPEPPSNAELAAAIAELAGVIMGG